MAAFYGRKILKEEINPKTELPWAIEDVPVRWQAATHAWIEAHS